MRLICNGLESNAIEVQKGEDRVLYFYALDDDGTPLDLTSPAVLTVELYPAPSRDSTSTATWTPTVVHGPSGYATFSLEDNTALLRGLAYLSGVWKSNGGAGAGTVVKIADKFTSLTLV